MASPPATGRSRWLVAVLVLAAGTVLSACGSGPSATSTASIIKAACAQVGADLSDGPDPSADPVGYAEAQILPLSKIKVADTTLQHDISRLDSAYKTFFATQGGAGSTTLVKRSLTRVEHLCPGVAS